MHRLMMRRGLFDDDEHYTQSDVVDVFDPKKLDCETVTTLPTATAEMTVAFMKVTEEQCRHILSSSNVE